MKTAAGKSSGNAPQSLTRDQSAGGSPNADDGKIRERLIIHVKGVVPGLDKNTPWPAKTNPDEPYLIVIGASAGGIEALERLAGALPEDFRAPLVVAQHADPNFQSHLGDILRRQTHLKVLTLQSTAELVPATIYLAPAGENVTVRGTRVSASGRLRGHPIPSIDALFISAAESYSDRVIALILTGMGTDGVAGVRAVKECGGTVLVQEPESAAFPALPAAIPLSHIDYTANLEALAPLITTLTSGPSDGEITIRTFSTHFSVSFGDAPVLILGSIRLPRSCDGFPGSWQRRAAKRSKNIMRHLTSHPEAYQRLISTFLIKGPNFFGIQLFSLSSATAYCRILSSTLATIAPSSGSGPPVVPPGKKHTPSR